ncbi:LOW QUALITY PROTEIN: hypothetical protein CRUP_033538, partial [Coryphaenoides rupestris]
MCSAELSHQATEHILTCDQSQAFHACEVCMFDGHHTCMGKQLLRGTQRRRKRRRRKRSRGGKGRRRSKKREEEQEEAQEEEEEEQEEEAQQEKEQQEKEAGAADLGPGVCEAAPQLLDDVDGVEVPGAPESQHSVHGQAGEVLLVVRQQLGGQRGPGDVQEVLLEPLRATPLSQVTPPVTAHTPRQLTDQDLGGGVVHTDGLEDGGPVIGDRHRGLAAAAQQDLVL